MAMRLATEKETFSRARRLPGLESSNIALQTLMGSAESVDFVDFLNGKIFPFVVPCFLVAYDVWRECIDPVSRPEVPRLELHAQMEVKLGLM